MRAKLTTEEFIKKAQDIHGDKYVYNSVVYIGATTKINIVCKKHGKFEQRPNKHLSGQGCPMCGAEIRIKKRILSTNQFIKKAKEAHDNKYDYRLVEYKDSKAKIKIICPNHGEFTQIPNNHLNGCGCPKCNGKY